MLENPMHAPLDQTKPICRIVNGDCRTLLQKLPDNYIQCVITSPPYWGLRDYKLPPLQWSDGWSGTHGLEPTYQLYLNHSVEIFREVRRVLRPDGLLWLNIGDSYAGGGHGGGGSYEKERHWRKGVKRDESTLKSKDLCGIPWRLALALQADGWYLRQDIIWHKSNPMPESVTDRCTKAHEYLFLLSKSPRYYFDAEAIKEQSTNRPSGNKKRKPAGLRDVPGASTTDPNGGVAGSVPWEAKETRNARSVWTISTKPYKEAHFATFPPDLVRPCILAGSPPNSLILDPFTGSGTVGMVANQLNRHALLFEQSPEYCKLARNRCGIC